MMRPLLNWSPHKAIRSHKSTVIAIPKTKNWCLEKLVNQPRLIIWVDISSFGVLDSYFFERTLTGGAYLNKSIFNKIHHSWDEQSLKYHQGHINGFLFMECEGNTSMYVKKQFKNFSFSLKKYSTDTDSNTNLSNRISVDVLLELRWCMQMRNILNTN